MKQNLLVLLLIMICHACAPSKPLSDKEILDIVNAHRPLSGYIIPADIQYRLGATHVDGKYYLSDKPFMIEGAEKLSDLGYGMLKLWFDIKEGKVKGYEYNSDWQTSSNTTLKELAAHPYYQACFNMPFQTISLCVNQYFPGNRTDSISEMMMVVEQNIYELSKYLLETYKNKDLTFILQNWEGDWLLRGGTGEEAMWHLNGPTEDYQIRIKNMIDWFSARQRGIQRARIEITESQCRVLHAVEANRVMDGMNGVPSVATHVLPQIETDLVSWSAYDGIDEIGLKMYKGIDFLKKQLRPTAYMNGNKEIMIGEIGYPENMHNRTGEQVRKMWDTFMAVYLAQDISYIFMWELYCNELKNDEFDRKQFPIRNANELRGFWLIRPDGSKSWAQEYMDLLLLNPGKQIIE